ncbi:MAG: SusC/RagA family TonB-linked outer membrane protein [Paraprevotella clara]|uniref:TonB-dependent Receptor Plug Domain protein n=1 Tax=Paraprevotella clara TaxID=454154 RepID=A0A6N3DYI4_9BACT|nr:SusC/RagA family TonB-linked outer membrane protein [Paraprevotella clara]MEE0574150.1 SusC/RagA family TonB-linked outer membrane protein [Paraprevotella clara]
MNMRRIECILLCLFIGILSMAAQTRTVTGSVFDKADNQPVIGATIAVMSAQGTVAHGTTTDLDGKFKLEVPSGTQNLTCRFMGYTTTTIHLQTGKDNYTVYMENDSKQLNELVVTGYQAIDRRKLTSAVTTIKMSDEIIGGVNNIDQALAGQIAGLSSVTSSGSPGAPVKLRIRGTASLSGTQDPLWVLDGIPLEGTDIPSMEDLQDIDNIYQTSIAGINPQDIESITVLKDAAATAIYGARAANGVIVITTKKGKAGKPQINFSMKLTYNPKTDIDRLNLLNSDEKVDLELGLLQSDYTYRENKGDVARIIAGYGLTDAYKAGGWNALSPEAQADINALRAVNTDWNDILFRGVFNQEYNVSLSGGSEKATYYSALGYYVEQGNVESVKNDRFNLTLKTDYRINSKLKVGASVFANRRKQRSYLTYNEGFTNPVYYSRIANPYMRPFDDEGNYIYDTNVQHRQGDDIVPDFNIFEERANTSNENTFTSLMSIFDAEFKWNEHFKVTSQFGLQWDENMIEKYAGQDSYAMRREKEQHQYNGTTVLPEGGSNKITENHSSQWTWKAMAEYQNRFKDIHELELMAGTEIRHNEDKSLYSAVYGYDARTLTSKPIIFPNEEKAESVPLHTETYLENAFVSWFATGSYTLLHRYTLGGSIRFDGSDIFGVAKKYRYLPLYSVSGLWRISDEPFMKNVTVINNLGLRASYGLQGNIDKNTSPYLIGIYDQTTILPGNSEDAIRPSSAPNPDLRWEKTQSANIGMDLSLWDNIISLSVDYYYRKGTDLIGLRMLPLETGYTSTTVNWAQMENEGVEVALTTRNIHTKDFTWFTNLNFGYNDNTVLRETVAENAIRPSREGYSVGAIFAYKTAGLDDEGYPLFLTQDGRKVTATEFFKLNNAGASTLSAEEQRNLYSYIGSTEPKVSGGFMNTFKYKRVTLGINCIFNFGMYVQTTPTYDPTNYDRGLNSNRDILNRWTPDHTNTTLPKLMTENDGRTGEYLRYKEQNLFRELDIWVKKQNYFRFESIRLGYELPEKWLKPVGIKSASVSLEGRNLWVIASNYHNYLDPETMGNPYAAPIPKSFIFGLNVNF